MQSAITESKAIETTAPPESALTVRRWVAFDDGAADIDPDDLVFDGPGVEAVAALCAGVILPTGDEQRAGTLIAAGADRVFIGDAALLDSAVIDRLVAMHGAERIGVYAPLRRQSISWSFETVSNADFKTVTPSNCEPAWEVLRADGTGSGALAGWWLMAMRDLGASHFLVRADIRDDTDLNLCAGLVEEFGDALWMGPLLEPAPHLADWVEFGQSRQIVLPGSAYSRRDSLLGAARECA